MYTSTVYRHIYRHTHERFAVGKLAPAIPRDQQQPGTDTQTPRYSKRTHTLYDSAYILLTRQPI